MSVNIFIQARMSSARFPGKMLAPLNGKPLIKHMIERVSEVPDIQNVVILTSAEQSDDPLVCYLEREEHNVFRGDLNNVFLRFQEALKAHPCESFVRICGDSPIINTDLIAHMVGLFKQKECDFLSNVHHKKFPKGQSIEMIKSNVFMDVDPKSLTSEQQEHVMPYFYENTKKYKSYFPDCTVNNRHINCCVDTIEDLKNIESGNITYDFKKEDVC